MQAECDIWRSRTCGHKKKVRWHELKVSRVRSEDHRADLKTKFLGPFRHHKLVKLLPLSVPRTRREMASTVALRVVCSLLPVVATASNQIEAVQNNEGVFTGGRLAGQRIKNMLSGSFAGFCHSGFRCHSEDM